MYLELVQDQRNVLVVIQCMARCAGLATMYPYQFCSATNLLTLSICVRTSTLAQITGNALIAVPQVFVTLPRKIWWYTFDTTILKETMLIYIECKKCKGGCLNRSHGLLVQLLYALTGTVIYSFFCLYIL